MKRVVMRSWIGGRPGLRRRVVCVPVSAASPTRAACYTTNPYLNPNIYGHECRRRACVGGSADRRDCSVAGDCPGGACTTIIGEPNAANFSLTNDVIRFTPPNNRAAIAPASVPPGPGSIVSLRYRFRVDANEGVTGSPPEFKLIYLPTRVHDATTSPRRVPAGS